MLGLIVFGTVTLVPTSATAAGSIGALTINPDSVRGESTTGTVSLGYADTQPTVVRFEPLVRPHQQGRWPDTQTSAVGSPIPNRSRCAATSEAASAKLKS